MTGSSASSVRPCGGSASSVGSGFKSRRAIEPRRWTAHVDSDRILNCAGVVAKGSVWREPLGVNYVNYTVNFTVN